MEFNGLLLRQRKLIFYLYGKQDYVTAGDLSEFLKVSDRTVRSDVNDINHLFNQFNISVESQRGKGYRLIAGNEQIMHEIIRTNENFMTKEDRIRYLAIKLVRSDEKINVLDLEDEMFVSIATIERDVQEIKKRFVENPPYLILNREDGNIWFGEDEYKKRVLLNNLLSADWNYDAKDSQYYRNDYIDRATFEVVLNTVNKYFRIHNIQMNDSGLVSVIYSIAIAFKRLSEGHRLSEDLRIRRRHELRIKMLPNVLTAMNEILDHLEACLECGFDDGERYEIARLVLNNTLLDLGILTRENVTDYIDRSIIGAADLFLERIQTAFQLNLAEDDAFYFVLLLHIRALQNRMYTEQKLGTEEHQIRESCLFEYELALLFQNISLGCFDFCLNETELLHLAMLLSGAVRQSKHPVRVLIICHLSSSVKWVLKQKLQWYFNQEATVVDTISVYEKQKVKAENFDLILSTASKKIVTKMEVPFFEISPLLSDAELDSIRMFINKRREVTYHEAQDNPLRKLADRSLIYANADFSNKESALKFLVSRMAEQNCCDESYFDQVVMRDKVSPLAFKKGMVLAYSISPCEKTAMSFATIRHRFLWNDCKIRVLCLLTMRPEDYSQLGTLLKLFYQENSAIPVSEVKSEEQLIRYFHLD
ncbi:HTH domain-containing protein [Anoxybacterium hadale]|uniref:HTH domain-containing protein n=1 Tax=Anoxybacterium hadale TaxID=3408580 RepID=A0ACD1ACN8_9FIRM|nr:HTH domain-containing protein [Clostridiales bacterium]